MKLLKPFLCIVIIIFFTRCTKEMPAKPEEKDWWKMDLTGYWNGYGYGDGVGRVPVEIIKITRGDGNKYIATKIAGDNAVPSGYITWQGYANSNPFKVDCMVGNGSDIHEVKDFADIIIESENVLRTNGFFGVMYVRRTDGYFP